MSDTEGELTMHSMQPAAITAPATAPTQFESIEPLERIASDWPPSMAPPTSLHEAKDQATKVQSYIDTAKILSIPAADVMKLRLYKHRLLTTISNNESTYLLLYVFIYKLIYLKNV
jgi:hypothetical protein